MNFALPTRRWKILKNKINCYRATQKLLFPFPSSSLILIQSLSGEWQVTPSHHILTYTFYYFRPNHIIFSHPCVDVVSISLEISNPHSMYEKSTYIYHNVNVYSSSSSITVNYRLNKFSLKILHHWNTFIPSIIKLTKWRKTNAN